MYVTWSIEKSGQQRLTSRKFFNWFCYH